MASERMMSDVRTELLSLIRDAYDIENPHLRRGDHEAGLAEIVKAILTRWPQIARAIEPGMVVVPEVATEEMLSAGCDAFEQAPESARFRDDLVPTYAAMIAAGQEPKV